MITNRDLEEIIISDTLHAGIMREANSYFLLKKAETGYNYELIHNFAKYLNVKLALHVVNDENDLTHLLSTGKIDIIAYNLYETKELKKDFHFVFPHFESHQVLVQRSGRNSIVHVSDLAGKEVHVKENSVFHKRLENLNKETGGTIEIVFTPDFLTNSDMIEMVFNNEILYTVSYYRDAEIYKPYFPKLDLQTAITFAQKSGWMIRKNQPGLLIKYLTWAELPETNKLQQQLESKYISKNPYVAERKKAIPERTLSPYDHLFKKYAPKIGWDWRLLASIAYHESNFDPYIVSPSGASGLMQLMPRTAEIYGVDSISIFDPEENIRASVEYLKELNKLFRKVEDNNERIKFILAGYNGGPYHIVDAMLLAGKYGKNPYIWYSNVEYFLDQKRYPEFYEDSIVKYGYFNSRETIRYVITTLNTYENYLEEF